MKKYMTHKNIALICLFVIFLFSNLIPPAGIAGGNFYEYSSGGYTAAGDNSAMEFRYIKVPSESFYGGSMNWILRPLSAVFPVIDIRVTGSIFFLMFFAMFAAVIYKMKFKEEWHAILFESMCVFVFGDFAYLLHFNTMRTQGLLLLAVLLMFIILLWQIYIKTSSVWSIVYCALCVFLAGLSEGWFLLGILFLTMIVPTFIVRRDKRYVITTVSSVVAGLALVVALFSGGVSQQIKNDNLINSVFYGIYKDESDRSISNDKISAELVEKYAGKSVYDINEEVNMELGYNDILTHYIKNPKLFKNKLEIASGNAFEIRARYIANDKSGALKNGFTLYSTLKRRFMQPSLWFVLAVFMGVAVFSGINARTEKSEKRKCHYIVLAILSFISLYAFVAPLIISGEAAISENLFCYNIIFDILFINMVAGGAIVASGRRDALKEKYGISQ